MPPDCTSQIDICIAIDGSASLSNQDFQDEKDYLVELGNGLGIAQDGVRTYLWDFASLVNAQWDWLDVENTDNGAFEAGVQGIVKNVGVTMLADAMKLCANTSFPESSDRPNAAKVAIIISDGRDNSPRPLEDCADELKAAAVDGVYAIGVGNVDEAALNTIASKADNVFTVPNWSDLRDALTAQQLLSQFCTPGEKECSCCCPEPKYIFPFSS
jgi:hypothetical protein